MHTGTVAASAAAAEQAALDCLWSGAAKPFGPNDKVAEVVKDLLI